MKDLKADFIKIYQTNRGVLIWMILNTVLALGLFIFAMLSLNPNAAVVKVGYGDIGGYRDGTWMGMASFPLLALTFGILHNILAARIFHKRGGTMAKFFLITTTMLILLTLVVLVRLLGEG